MQTQETSSTQFQGLALPGRATCRRNRHNRSSL